MGQEGIDFHWWCHAVLHWNTPPNPVDFEQREGRVDRFRGHAIRKNVAAAHGRGARRAPAGSPWTELFALAEADRDSGELARHGGFVPDWVYPGPARIQRHLTHFALSKDQDQYERVEGDVAVYRLTLGQPRQEDMLALLRGRPADAPPPARIDLTPKGVSWRNASAD